MSYNPHDAPDLYDEMKTTGAGRLVKARLTDQPPPNVSWFWIATGNCAVCKYFADTKCLNGRVTTTQFLNDYVWSNNCPEFAAGVSDEITKLVPSRADVLDVMKAIGLVKGAPAQGVEVIVNEPWSIRLAQRAHREQSVFMDMAVLESSGTLNNPTSGEYVDFSDDLERPTAQASPAAP